MAILQKTRMIMRYGNRADLKQLATGEFGFTIDSGELFIGAPNLTSQNSGNLKIKTETNNDYISTYLQPGTLNSTDFFTVPTPIYTINSYNFDKFDDLNANGNLYESPSLPIITNITYKLLLGRNIIEDGTMKIISCGYFNQSALQYYDKNVNDILGLGQTTPSISKNEDIGVYLYDTSKYIDAGNNYICCVPYMYNETSTANYYDNSKNIINYVRSSSYVQFFVTVNQKEITLNDNTTKLNTSLRFYAAANLINESSEQFILNFKLNGDIT